MAEIKIQKKKNSSAGMVILVIILLALVALLILDGLEVISTPDWIHGDSRTIENQGDNNF